MYNIHQLISSLIGLYFENWTAFLLNTDREEIDLQEVVDTFDHQGRFIISSLSTRSEYSVSNAYDMTDAAIAEHCDPHLFRWLLVTNGKGATDNMYERTTEI